MLHKKLVLQNLNKTICERMKKITTLYLEEEIVNSAKSRGVNLSRFLESKLQDFMKINDPEYARVVGLENAKQFDATGSSPFKK